MKLFKKYVLIKARDYEDTKNQCDSLQNEILRKNVLIDKLKKEKGYKEPGDYCSDCKNAYKQYYNVGFLSKEKYCCRLNIPCLDYKQKEREDD